jgi:hypothetical protein
MAQDIFVALRCRLDKRNERPWLRTAVGVGCARRPARLGRQSVRISTTRTAAQRDVSCQIVTRLPVWLHS